MKATFFDIKEKLPTPGQSIVFVTTNGQRFFGNVSDERGEIVVDVDDPGCEKEFGPMIRFTADEIKVWSPVEFEEGGKP